MQFAVPTLSYALLSVFGYRFEDRFDLDQGAQRQQSNANEMYVSAV